MNDDNLLPPHPLNNWLPHIEANLRLQQIAEILGEDRMKWAEGDHAAAAAQLVDDLRVCVERYGLLLKRCAMSVEQKKELLKGRWPVDEKT